MNHLNEIKLKILNICESSIKHKGCKYKIYFTLNVSFSIGKKSFEIRQLKNIYN